MNILPLTICVTLVMLLNLSSLTFPFCKEKIIPNSQGFCFWDRVWLYCQV